jgi:predicted AlkP superfamily phosphohydrolase/phosphomutase
LLENSFGIFKKMGLKYLPHSFQEKVFRSRFRGFAERMESSSRFKGIVWDRTAAFSEDLGYCPSIHINLKGREPEGTVTGIAEYNRIRDKIIDKILKWKNPETGNSIVRHALKREDVYKGDYVHLAPDIILDFNTDRGYSYLCLPHGSFSSDDAFKRLSKDELTGARLLSMSGSHRPEGIFLLSGRDVSLSGRLPFKTSIQDIYPAILSFFGITPDKEIDGRKIDIFNDLKEDSIDTCQGEEKEKKCIPYTDDQEKKLAERLKNLGYLD